MVGIRDITKHILYLAEKEGYPENKFYKTGLEKVVFLAFAHCIYFNLKIRYDILFYKSKWGATSREVRDLFGERFGRHVSYKHSKRIEELENNEKLNEYLINLIKKEAEEPFSVSLNIINSDVFVNSKFYKLFKEGMNNQENDYKIRSKDNSIIWTLEEIFLFANVSTENIDDLRIPLKEKEFNVILKYLKLKEMFPRDDKYEICFTFDEILTLRSISDSIIESAEVNGVYLA